MYVIKSRKIVRIALVTTKCNREYVTSELEKKMNKRKTNKTSSLYPIEGTKGRRKGNKKVIRKKAKKKKWKNDGKKLTEISQFNLTLNLFQKLVNLT